jgi:hypothetical protein
VIQGLGKLFGEVVGLKLLLGIPANLAAHMHESAFGDDAVGVSTGSCKALWLDEF